MFEHLQNRIPKQISEEDQRLSAVVLPLIKIEGEYHLLFEVRANTLHHQPGEVCFPGGRVDAYESTRAAAIREVKEELLVGDENLKIYGPLDYFFSPGHMKVQPYLGELFDYKGQFSKAEVAEVFTVPLSFFKKTEPKIAYCDTSTIPRDDFPYELVAGGKDYPWAKGAYDVYFYEYEGHIIWGMTAKMLAKNLHFIKTSD